MIKSIVISAALLLSTIVIKDLFIVIKNMVFLSKIKKGNKEQVQCKEMELDSGLKLSVWKPKSATVEKLFYDDDLKNYSDYEYTPIAKAEITFKESGTKAFFEVPLGRLDNKEYPITDFEIAVINAVYNPSDNTVSELLANQYTQECFEKHNKDKNIKRVMLGDF